MLTEFMKTIDTDVIGKNFNDGKDGGVDNKELIAVNDILRSHPVEKVGAVLRKAMTDMKKISTEA
jgi:ketol-acid reductoisomerase